MRRTRHVLADGGDLVGDRVATGLPPRSAAFSASTSSTPARRLAISATMVWNSAFLATKSVSEFTSTATPLPPSTLTATRPSAAVRPDFLAALARPLVRSQSTAASMSPSVSVSAFLRPSCLRRSARAVLSPLLL
jgi:hypothetical protein